ncbi:MAG: hypothetical protein QM754_07895 [Tepidisphaeraceae bacterium]
MSGLSNDFVWDQVVSASVTEFAKMGLVKGGAASVATVAVAGVTTAAAMMAPIAIGAGIIWLLGGFDTKPKTK